MDSDDKKTDPMSEEGLYLKLKDNFLADARHSSDWRKQAEKDFDFVAGEQWDKDTAKTLTDQNRVPITFNLSLGIIKAVAGLEINGRHETVFYPRDTSEGDIVANEMLNGCSKWMGQNCDAEDNQSEAFQHTLICGMGWTESRMDYEIEPEGAYIEEQCDPIEMYWDRSARAKNLADSRRMWRVRKMSLEDARALAERLDLENVEDADLNATWALGQDVPKDAVPVENRALREGNSGGPAPDEEVYIVQAQWWERETYWRVANPFNGKIESMDEKGVQELRDKAREYYEVNYIDLPVDAVKQTRRVYKQAFLGRKILGGVRDCPRKDGFTFGCITGQLHKNKGTWFGLITLVREPQMMANKWLSQTQHILNTTAKGGILAERTAFRDVREAQSTYARPDAVTLVEDGAISGGKIMQKPGAGIVGPYLQLLEYAVSGVWRVTGMNQEIMGMRDINQPGVLEQQRKQAAMTILSTLFDSLRRYRKDIGRVRLFFIQNFLSDGRIIRIMGDKGPKAVKLVKDKTLGQYDVIVDDSPTSPNAKEQTFAMLMQLLPHLRGQGLSPEMIIIFLEYSPLPREAVEQFKKILMKPPTPEQQQQQQLALQAAQAKIGKDVASAGKDQATAAESRAEAVLDLAQAGVHASAEELNRVKTAAVGFKMMRDTFGGMGDVGVMPEESPYQVPMPRQVPTAPRNSGMLSIDDIVSQVAPDSPAQGPV